MSFRKYFTSVILVISGAAIVILSAVLLFSTEPSATYATTDAKHCEIHDIDINLCTRCNPELIADFKASGDWCAEHNLPESQCDLCGGGHEDHNEADETDEHDGHNHSMDTFKRHTDISQEDYNTGISVFFPENVINCATDEAIIQLASIKTAERTGITFQPAIATESSPIIEAPAEILFDETSTTVLSTTISALVTKWLVEAGQKITKGEILARLESPELPKLKAEYLEAYAAASQIQKRFNRQKELYQKKLISDSEYEDIEMQFQVAEAHLTGSAGLLKSAGLADEDLKDIIENKVINQNLQIRAPNDGVIIDRIAFLGELLAKGQALALIGDPGSLWIEARVSEDDIKKIKLGSTMEFSSDGNSLHRCTGEIIWIAQFLDEETRTATVRAKINNNSDMPRSGEFGRAEMKTGIAEKTVMIPKDAVQWEGCCNIVFVKETIDRFRPRKVKIEPGINNYYRVLEGLNEGEEVVVAGSYLLKTELRKGSIGAGCAGH